MVDISLTGEGRVMVSDFDDDILADISRDDYYTNKTEKHDFLNFD